MDALVFDVGGTFIKVATFNNDEIVDKKEIKTPLRRSDFIKIIRDEINKSGLKKVSFSMPGIIDEKKKYAYTTGALFDMYEFDFQKEFGDLVDQIEVENDAKCAALAEVAFGSLKDYQDAICLVIGTGIGGCVILDKKIRKGLNLASGEVSSIITSSSDIPDSSFWLTCGVNGLISIVNKEANTNFKDGKELFSHLELAHVKEGIKKYTDLFAVQIYNMQALMDVECFSIGGGVSASDYLIESIKSSLDEVFEKMGKAPIKKPIITVCKYRNSANLYGAYSKLK